MLDYSILYSLGHSLAEQLWSLKAPADVQQLASDPSWKNQIQGCMDPVFLKTTAEEQFFLGYQCAETLSELAARELIEFSLSSDVRMHLFLRWHQLSHWHWISGSGHPEYWLLRKTHDFLHGPDSQDLKPSRFDRLPTHGLHHLAFGLSSTETYTYETNHRQRLALIGALAPFSDETERNFMARYASDPRVRRGDTSWLEQPARQSLSQWLALNPRSFPSLEELFKQHHAQAWFGCATRGLGSAKPAAILAHTGLLSTAFEILKADSSPGFKDWLSLQRKTWASACSDWKNTSLIPEPSEPLLFPSLPLLTASERATLSQSFGSEIHFTFRLKSLAFERLMYWFYQPEQALQAGARTAGTEASLSFATHVHQLCWSIIDLKTESYLAARADHALLQAQDSLNVPPPSPPSR